MVNGSACNPTRLKARRLRKSDARRATDRLACACLWRIYVAVSGRVECGAPRPPAVCHWSMMRGCAVTLCCVSVVEQHWCLPGEPAASFSSTKHPHTSARDRVSMPKIIIEGLANPAGGQLSSPTPNPR